MKVKGGFFSTTQMGEAATAHLCDASVGVWVYLVLLCPAVLQPARLHLIQHCQREALLTFSLKSFHLILKLKKLTT